ncbi:hypothetical protein GGF31_007370 [Allomyces arbusculus]|nr:hypothetical protein GGF31_007370 [Allomyces arbusculus]
MTSCCTVLAATALVISLLFPTIVQGGIGSCSSSNDCEGGVFETCVRGRCMPKMCSAPSGFCYDYDPSTYCDKTNSCVPRLGIGIACILHKTKWDAPWLYEHQCQDGLACDPTSNTCTGTPSSPTAPKNPTATAPSAAPATLSAARSAPTSTPSPGNGSTSSTMRPTSTVSGWPVTRTSTSDTASPVLSSSSSGDIARILGGVVVGFGFILMLVQCCARSSAAQPAKSPTIKPSAAAATGAAQNADRPVLMSKKIETTTRNGCTTRRTTRAFANEAGETIHVIVTEETLEPKNAKSLSELHETESTTSLPSSRPSTPPAASGSKTAGRTTATLPATAPRPASPDFETTTSPIVSPIPGALRMPVPSPVPIPIIMPPPTTNRGSTILEMPTPTPISPAFTLGLMSMPVPVPQTAGATPTFMPPPPARPTAETARRPAVDEDPVYLPTTRPRQVVETEPVYLPASPAPPRSSFVNDDDDELYLPTMQLTPVVFDHSALAARPARDG